MTPAASHATRSPRHVLDAALLLATGGADYRAQTIDVDRRIRRSVPLSCRCLIVPTSAHCGSWTLAGHLAAVLTRTRQLPGLLLNAAPGDADALARPWPPPLRPPPPATAKQARALVGVGPDGLLGRLQLPGWQEDRPRAWDDARARLFRFYDTIITHAGYLGVEELTRSARHVHAIVMVSRARRRDVERSRGQLNIVDRVLDQASGNLDYPRRARLLHAFVATDSSPVLIPRLGDTETLIPHDSVLARTSAVRTATPGFLERRTGLAIAGLAAELIDSAASGGEKA